MNKSKIEIRSGVPVIVFPCGGCRPCGHAEYEIIKELKQKIEVYENNIIKGSEKILQLEQNRVELLQEYTQFLYSHGYIDDDWMMEQPSPIHEFLNRRNK